jgi:hypothetical protein
MVWKRTDYTIVVMIGRGSGVYYVLPDVLLLVNAELAGLKQGWAQKYYRWLCGFL